jgi:hypothetical protein
MSVAKSTKEAAQKRKELDWFLSFQQKCSDCPRSNPVQLSPPFPDIFLEENNLGVEITQYLLNQGETGSHPCRLETTREGILRTAQSLHESRSHDCLLVSVQWGNSLCPAKCEQRELAQAISQAVLMGDKFSRPWHIEWREFENPLLQKYIHGISVFAHEGKSCWTNCTGLIFGTLDYMVESFQELISAKKDRIEEYRKTSARLWLLIVADKNLFSSDISSHDALLRNTFNSEFDRVFVLDEHRDKLLELRLANEIQVSRRVPARPPRP